MIQVRYASILILFLLPFGVDAQVDKSGQWQFPTTMKGFCLSIEQTYVAHYKSLVENNRKLSSQKTKEDIANVMALSNTYKESMKELEDKWGRLDCTQILYRAN